MPYSNIITVYTMGMIHSGVVGRKQEVICTMITIIMLKKIYITTSGHQNLMPLFVAVITIITAH